MADENFFQFQGLGGGRFCGSGARIVGEAESDFAFGQGLEEIERFFVELDSEFKTAAEKIDIWRSVGSKSGEFGGDLANLGK